MTPEQKAANGVQLIKEAIFQYLKENRVTGLKALDHALGIPSKNGFTASAFIHELIEEGLVEKRDGGYFAVEDS